MYKIILRYLARVHGPHFVTFPAFDYKPKQKLVSRVVVEAPDTGNSLAWHVHITVEFHRTPSEKEATLIGYKLATDVVDRLAFDFAIGIESPLPNGGNVWKLQPDGSPEGGGKVFNQLPLFLNGDDTFTPPQPLLANVSRSLSARKVRGQKLIRLVRKALAIDNVVEKYLRLYRILIAKFGDSQEKTDAWLNQEFGDLLTVRPSDVNKLPTEQRWESAYTRVRNEFAHIREGSSLESTCDEMGRLTAGLTERVKRATETK